jgi:transposase-like protein
MVCPICSRVMHKFYAILTGGRFICSYRCPEGHVTTVVETRPPRQTSVGVMARTA